jgi:hypothetical protein
MFPATHPRTLWVVVVRTGVSSEERRWITGKLPRVGTPKRRGVGGDLRFNNETVTPNKNCLGGSNKVEQCCPKLGIESPYIDARHHRAYATILGPHIDAVAIL